VAQRPFLDAFVISVISHSSRFLSPNYFYDVLYFFSPKVMMAQMPKEMAIFFK
jgi:hypothetical protein